MNRLHLPAALRAALACGIFCAAFAHATAQEAPTLVAPRPSVVADETDDAAPSPSDAPQPVAPATPAPIGRAADQVWIINARRAACGADCGDLPVQRQVGCGQWSDASLADFLAAADPSMPTVIFVHGNQVSECELPRYGLAMYRALACQMPADLPVRFVIWSWPSSKVKGLLQDVRIKAGRTDRAGYQLACVLNRIDPSTPVGLIGYSFGARISSGAAHLLGGGRLGSYQLAEPIAPERMPLRMVLMASAFNNDWLLPGRYHGQALEQTDKLLLINNSNDRALRHYHRLYGYGAALGATGFAGLSRLGEERERIEQVNAACIVGPEHDMFNYLASPCLMSQAWQALAPEIRTEPELAAK